MSSQRAQSMLFAHNVAERRGTRRGGDRARTKALMYLRVRQIATDVGVAHTESANVCRCNRAAYPHLHQFGGVTHIPHNPTSKAVADSVIKRHNWHYKGTKVVWKGTTHDHKVRKQERAKAEVRQATTLADRLKRALQTLENLDSPHYLKKAAALEILDITDKEVKLGFQDIWKKALRRRAK